MEKKTVYIQILDGDSVVDTNKYSQENIIIGSGPAAHLRMEDPQVSRIHAMLKVNEHGEILLSDLGWSSEGTLHNGRKIDGEAQIEDGDLVQIGSSYIRVFGNPPGEVAAPMFGNIADADDDILNVFGAPGEAEGPTVKRPLPDFGKAVSAKSKREDDDLLLPPVMEEEDFAFDKKADPFAGIKSSPFDNDGDFGGEAELDQEPDFPVTDEPLPPAPSSVIMANFVRDEMRIPSAAAAPPASDYGAPLIAEPAAPIVIDTTPIPDDQLPPSIRRDLVQEDQSKGERLFQVRFLLDGTPVEVGHFDRPRIVTVGTHPLNDFSFADEKFPDQNYPLVIPFQGSFGVFFTNAFHPVLTKADGTVVSADALKGQFSSKSVHGLDGQVYAVAPGEVFALEGQSLNIEFSYTYPTKAYNSDAYRNRDYLFWRVIAFSAIVHSAMILMFQFVPLGPMALGETVLKGRFAKMIVVPPPEIKKKQEKKFELKKEEKKDEDIKEDKKTDETKEAPKEDAPADPKQRDMQRVKKSGLLGLLSSGMGDMGPGGDLFGKAQDQQFLGKLLGSAGGASFGMGGAGRGFGAGGGGGGGGYGGGSWGYGGRKRVYGRGGMNLRGQGRGKTITQIQPGRLILKGALTKEQIARVIQMHWAQIRYCYEKELTKNPKLGGKVVIAWRIGGTGAVETANVKSTTMNNDAVENCITRRIIRWKFPVPQGGGVVDVNYPFIFKVAG